jgi:hypothetical protein
LSTRALRFREGHQKRSQRVRYTGVFRAWSHWSWSCNDEECSTGRIRLQWQMVAIEWEPSISVRAHDNHSTVADPPCPRWLQGIATINRMRSGGAEPIDPDAVPAALVLMCTHGSVAGRLSGAKMLGKIARHGDPEVIDALLGTTISSAGFGEFWQQACRLFSCLTCTYTHSLSHTH